MIKLGIKGYGGIKAAEESHYIPRAVKVVLGCTQTTITIEDRTILQKAF